MVFPAQGGKLMNVGGMNRTIPISIRSFGKKRKTKRKSSKRKSSKKYACHKCNNTYDLKNNCKHCKIKYNFVKKDGKYICTDCYYTYCNICERIEKK